MISSNAQAGGLQIASASGIPAKVISRKAFTAPEAYSDAIFAACRAAGAPWVVMGGFLTHVLIPPDFENRVLNIHPGTDSRVQRTRVLWSSRPRSGIGIRAKISGCTVHFVDNQYDHGPILLQKIVPVLDDDTPGALAARVFQAECEAYPEALRLLIRGKVLVEGRHVRVGN